MFTLKKKKFSVVNQQIQHYWHKPTYFAADFKKSMHSGHFDPSKESQFVTSEISYAHKKDPEELKC